MHRVHMTCFQNNLRVRWAYDLHFNLRPKSGGVLFTLDQVSGLIIKLLHTRDV